MPQSFLALGAIVIVTFLSLQQTRHATHTQIDKIDIDVTTMATQIAVDRLDEMRLLAFDEATKGDRIWLASQMTTLLPFSSDPEHLFESFPERRAAHGTGPDVAHDDLDDFDAATHTVVKSTQEGTLQFSVDTVVGYVQNDSIGANSSVPTNIKKAFVRVTAVGVQPVASVTISQIFSCGSPCAW